MNIYYSLLDGEYHPDCEYYPKDWRPYYGYYSPSHAKYGKIWRSKEHALSSWKAMWKSFGIDIPKNSILLASKHKNAKIITDYSKKNISYTTQFTLYRWKVELCPCGCGNDTCFYGPCHKERVRLEKIQKENFIRKTCFLQGHSWIKEGENKYICFRCKTKTTDIYF